VSDPNAQPPSASPADDLGARLARRVVGQPDALQRIIPYVQMHQTGLAPEGRPVGVFLLLGPTGTGKTRTVEALAEVLHGDAGRLVRLDCGEFQSEHEVAKLIGAPPGYVGHRESQPRITQQRLRETTTHGCDLSLVLFDEIEKAAPSLTVLLLGILDKATLQLGDGSPVDFQRSLIFLTSNLGAREMMSVMHPTMGFRAEEEPEVPRDLTNQLERIGLTAVRQRFSPEFVNRIDVIVTYQPLDEQALAKILEHQITDLQRHVHSRLGRKSFDITVTRAARAFLAELGTSAEYGARELKRTIHRHLTQPLAAKVASGEIGAAAEVEVDRDAGGEGLVIRVVGQREPNVGDRVTVLIVDDNLQLLKWLQLVLEEAGYAVLTAGTVEEATRRMTKDPDVVLLDYLLPDGDGCQLGVRLRAERPLLEVALMTGLELPPEEEVVCRERDIPVLRKPFLAEQVRALIQSLVPGDRAAQAEGG
jgi:CheY-like chemotaxis protein